MQDDEEEERRYLLSNLTDNLDKQFHSKDHGPYKIIGAYIRAQNLMAQLDSLPPHSRTFTLITHILNKGIYVSDGPSGVIDPEMEKVIKGISRVLGFYTTEKNAISKQRLLQNIITLAIPLSIMAIYHAVHHGIGRTKKKEKGDIDEYKKFTAELALHMILGSNLVQITFKSLSEGLELEEEIHHQLANILCLILTLFSIVTLTKGDREKMAEMINSLKEFLVKGLKSTKSFLKKAKKKKETKEISSLYIATQQALENLSNSREEAFLDTILTALKSADVNFEKLLGEVLTLSKLEEQLYKICAVDSTEFNLTSTSIIHAG